MDEVMDQANGDSWHLYNGDCCEVLKGIPAESIDFCIHSPPFSSLYIYSDSENDMGNCEDDAEFFLQRVREFAIAANRISQDRAAARQDAAHVSVGKGVDALLDQAYKTVFEADHFGIVL